VAKTLRYAPMFFSGACLASALFFSVTDTAFRLRGCRSEDYPELFFLILVAPVAVAAVATAILALRSARKWPFASSIVLSVLCVAMTIFALIEPGSGGC
jgi:cytochrome bd-type quinol oxidase subunit 2